ncbi:MAG: UDP-N-acetylmuramyl-tripeptide synthetase [Candidatus Spechtbacterales bacterium]
MKDLLKRLVPAPLLKGYYALWPALGRVRYGAPSTKLKVIGVTGTNGKTTTTHLITHILEEAGYTVASLSSLRFKVGKREWANKTKMTMPGRLTVHALLHDAVKAGCQYAVLEITSEGIKQQRHRAITFDAAVFTNLAPEHVESHGSFERYRAAKEELFKRARSVAVINVDDENAPHFARATGARVLGYHAEGKKAQFTPDQLVTATDVSLGKEQSAFTVKLPGAEKPTRVIMPLVGMFNIYNALAAITLTHAYGVPVARAAMALKHLKQIAGRMEVIVREPFSAIVDLAHTPDALEQVYELVRNEYRIGEEGRKLICALGSAGGSRDHWKRPSMGRVAGRFCDEVILTTEDTHGEKAGDIIDAIAEGVGEQAKVRKIENRRAAIREALKAAHPGDVVLITGKGAEPYHSDERGAKIPWDDRAVVREELEKLHP